jgi:hypothetical protein
VNIEKTPSQEESRRTLPSIVVGEHMMPYCTGPKVDKRSVEIHLCDLRRMNDQSESQLSVETGGFDEIEVAERVAADRAGQTLFLRKVTISWHGLVAWLRSPGLFTKLILAGGSFALVVWPLWEVGWQKGVVATVLWVGIGLWKAWREISPRNMQMLQRNYLLRKLLLDRLIQDLQQARDGVYPEAVLRFQEETLRLIVSYVRDHRIDPKGTTVFANLLIEDGEDLVVVARDHTHRTSGARYPKRGLVAWLAIATGNAQIVGDVLREFPDTARDKKYRSILVIPVRYGKKVVGAVSIDSSRTYHFDRDFRDLVEYVTPYVSLLGWTLVPTASSVGNEPE